MLLRQSVPVKLAIQRFYWAVKKGVAKRFNVRNG